jgi:hypothetical protein
MVDIVKVDLPLEVSVYTLQKMLLDGLKSSGGTTDVCIYYVKNARSLDDAGIIMNEYSQEHPKYKVKEKRFDVNKYIIHLNLSKGGRRHQRSSRRGKGNCRGKKSRSSRSRRSRSSRSLRRSRR